MAGLLGMRPGGELRPAADINVTSLVDVAFVLLIIFMITAPIMQGGVDVQLPRAEARPLQPKEGLVVSINRSGQIFVDETALSFEDFRAAFPAMVAARKPSGVYLRGDQRVQYGVIVRVLAVMRQSGIGDVGLVAEAEDIGR
jgi:biopolymer transport protein ExbD/biopolymer transport protein TolR